MLMWHLGRISYFNKKCIKDYNVSFEKIDTDETTGKQSKATDAECSNKRLEGWAEKVQDAVRFGVGGGRGGGVRDTVPPSRL